MNHQVMGRSCFLFPRNALRKLQEGVMQCDTLEANSLALACVLDTRTSHLHPSFLPSRHGSVVLPHTLEVTGVAKWLALFQDLWVEMMGIPGWRMELFAGAVPSRVPFPAWATSSASAHWVPEWDVRLTLQVTHMGHVVWARKKAL